jgi:Cofactor assembly of complex C subunit B, CCB2/CCB4
VAQVEPDGVDVSYTRDGTRSSAKVEMKWAWQALSSATCCRSLVVFHSGVCVFQAGLMPNGVKPGRGRVGRICENVMKAGKANYLANLLLFPGMRPVNLPTGQLLLSMHASLEVRWPECPTTDRMNGRWHSDSQGDRSLRSCCHTT